MSKVAAYLRGHLSGEVITRTDVRKALSRDRGVLSIEPEIVVYPRTTNDIRKLARFSWQLAEKGHTLGLTARGGGYDGTGAAIGAGAVVVLPAHMNRVFEYNAKQKLVRLQPGVTVTALSQALGLYGSDVAALRGLTPYATVGGALASTTSGRYADKYGSVSSCIDQLEVVLANGDVIMTSKISKKELNRRKGLQTFEGDIYRGIDGILEEYADVINKIDGLDNSGHSTIADVRGRDGSFNLTPLFVGSQGTLGIISEMILKTEFLSPRQAVAALVFGSTEAAHDALDTLAAQSPAFLEYFDATLFDAAAKEGRTYSWYTSAANSFIPAAVVMVGFDDFNTRHRAKHLKKIEKQFAKAENVAVTTANDDAADELMLALEITESTTPDKADMIVPSIYNGFAIPSARFAEFVKELGELAEKEHISLPLAGHALAGVYGIYPQLSLHKVADKQKILKVLDALVKLISKHGGTVVAEGGEGRLKTHAVYATLDERVVEMNAAIRKVCDPHGTLNPGVKQSNDVRTIVGMLASDAGIDRHAGFSS